MRIQSTADQVKPGDIPPVPTTKDELLIEALRVANRTSLMLNQLDAALLKEIESDDDHRFDDMHDLLLRRFSDCSGLHLFIAASNIGIELPEDLRGDEETN